MGVDITKVALAAGHAVVVSGRNSEKAGSVLGAHDDLMVVLLASATPVTVHSAWSVMEDSG